MALKLKRTTVEKIDDVCDFVILRMADAGDDLSLLKLQKLLFYIQAWYLAFHKTPLFKGRFQAWVHGPVNRHIYDRFSGTKMLYSTVGKADVREDFDVNDLSKAAQTHIKNVLDIYGKYTGNQLEELSHNEDPWDTARAGCAPQARCENEIDEKLMATYYAAKAAKK